MKTIRRQGSGKQKWVPKGDGEREEDRGAEDAPTAADVYDKFMMLQIYRLGKQDRDSQKPSSKSASEDQAECSKELGYKVQERPDATPATGEEAPTGRRGRELKKSKTGSSDALGDATPSVSDAQEMWANFANMNPFLQAYLGRTAFAMPPMFGVQPTGGTTVMLRNIPNRYTRDMLIEQLNKGYPNQYDFVYLPIDFNSKCNVGYAFINFRTPARASEFISEYHNAKTKQCLPGFGSNKVCEVSYARVQGRDQNMENLRDEKFIEKLQERPEWQPLFYDERNEEIPFSKTLGTTGSKKKGKAGATPTSPFSPASFMMPGTSPFSMFGPMMYPGAMGATPPAAPSVTMASVLPASTAETMLRLKGIPKTFTRTQLVDKFMASFKGDFDFLFVPLHAKDDGNRGFCFINFRTAVKAKEFTESYQQKPAKDCFTFPEKAEEAEKEQLCEVEQGRKPSIEKSIEKVQMPTKEGKGTQLDKTPWQPLMFDEDGAEQPFPKLLSGSAGDVSDASPTGGKGKGKGKGKGSPHPMLGFPGFSMPGMPGMPGYNVPSMPQGQQQAAALAQVHAFKTAAMFQQAQAQHFWAAAAASAHSQGYEAPTSPKSTKPRGKPLTDAQKVQLKGQLEFYFSTENLCKDLFLRQQMEEDGWVSLDLISTFNRVKSQKATVDELSEILTDSSVLEVNSETRQVRLKDAELREKWAKASAGDAASPQASAS